MKFTVNLARVPAENRRRTWVMWGGFFAAAFALLLVLGIGAAVSWRAATRVRARTQALEGQIPALEGRETALVAELSRADTKRGDQRLRLLNALIDRKAVSWTRLFERLEALVPAQVQLLSIRPDSGDQGSAIELIVGAANVADAMPLVQALEQAPDFSQPRVQQLAEQRRAPGMPPVTLRIDVQYRPSLGGEFSATSAAALAPGGGRP